MSKNNSGKKNPIKKSGKKDYVAHYEPLFPSLNQSVPVDKRSNSLTPDKQRRQTIPGDIPSILKRNIAALSESTDSIKLTDFGKSFVTDDCVKTPPKKKSKSLFDKLQYDDTRNIEIVPSALENKRLKSVMRDLRAPVMFSSPSILNEQPSISRSPEQKFPTAVDAFDKLKRLDNKLNDSKIKSNDVVIINDNSKDEKTSKDENVKKMDKEVSVPDSNSLSNSTIDQPYKIDENIIKNYRESTKIFREALNGLKSISATIVKFRRELEEGLSNDFSESPLSSIDEQ